MDGRMMLWVRPLDSLEARPLAGSPVSLHISPVGITSHAFFTIADEGTDIRAIHLDPGSVITTVAKKQFPQDGKH